MSCGHVLPASDLREHAEAREYFLAHQHSAPAGGHAIPQPLLSSAVSLPSLGPHQLEMSPPSSASGFLRNRLGSEQREEAFMAHRHHVEALAQCHVESMAQAMRLLEVAEGAARERDFLLQTMALPSPNASASNPPSPPRPGHPPRAHVDFPEVPRAPVLLRDEGGLFRLVSQDGPDALQAQKAPRPGPPLSAGGAGALPGPSEGPDDLESDHFRMFRFKVQMCNEARCHDWAQCAYAHPGEKAARRDPRVYRYSALPCPDVKRSGKCARGDACSLAHGVFECWLHPSRYRTQPCKDGPRCPRKVCFFAHSSEQLRMLPAAAAAAAADAAAGEVGMGHNPVAWGPSSPDACMSPTLHTGKLQRRSFDGVQPTGSYVSSSVSASSSPPTASSPASILSPVSSSPPRLGAYPSHSEPVTSLSLRDTVALDPGWLGASGCGPRQGGGAAHKGAVYEGAAHHHSPHVLPLRHSIDLPSHHRGATPGVPPLFDTSRNVAPPQPPQIRAQPQPQHVRQQQQPQTVVYQGHAAPVPRAMAPRTAGFPGREGVPAAHTQYGAYYAAESAAPPAHMPHGAHANRHSAAPVLPVAPSSFHCRPQAVAEEEPDLKWVSDLVQDF